MIGQLRLQEPRIRWTPAAHLHFTLAFLGEISTQQLETVVGASRTAAAGTAPFEARLGTLGTFPHPSAPRIVWLGLVLGEQALGKLQADLTRALLAREWPGSDRPFVPHLTLGRVPTGQRLKIPLDAWSALLPVFPAMPVTELMVMRSCLTPSGAQYTALETLSLSGCHSI